MTALDPMEIAAGVVVLGAAAGVLRKAVQAARSMGRKLDALHRLLEPATQVVRQELTANHGSSIKDDVHGMAVALGEVQRRLDDVDAGQEAQNQQLADIDRRVRDHLEQKGTT